VTVRSCEKIRRLRPRVVARWFSGLVRLGQSETNQRMV
jgi:hypothetical protein